MEKKKQDYFIKTIAYQVIFCIIAFGTLYGLKASNSNLYFNLKTDYFDNLDGDFDFIEDVKRNASNDSEDKSNGTVGKIFAEDKNTKEDIANSNASKDENIRIIEDVKPKSTTLKATVTNERVENDNTPPNVSVSGYSINKRMVAPLKIDNNITSDFGMRLHPISGEKRFHAGIDIGSPIGTPIHASFDGKVIKAEYDQWNGNHIKLMHDSKIMTVYCHCSKLNVKKGDNVKAGEIIGYVGSTGCSTGPHLHFEFRINNISYDPKLALQGAIDEV